MANKLCSKTLLITFFFLGFGLAFSLNGQLKAQQFANPLFYPTSQDPYGIVTGDWNGDGYPDLAYISIQDSPVLYILLNNRHGGFTQGQTIVLPAGTCSNLPNSCSIYAGYFDHSGHLGILMPSSLNNDSSIWGLVFLPGKGDGTFGSPVTSIVPPPITNDVYYNFVSMPLAIGDFNGDGNLDLAVPDYYDAQVRIYYGDGTGKFSAGPILTTPLDPYAVFAADVNHDGHLDIVALNVYSTECYATVFLGNGKGDFTSAANYPGTSTDFMADLFVDLNGDGYPDVVGTNSYGNILVMTGNKDGTFNEPVTIDSNLQTPSGRWTAINAVNLTGGKYPSLLAGSEEGFQTAVPTSALKYGAPQTRTSGIFSSQLAVADFNHDGLLDLALGSQGGIEFFLGNKSGVFPDTTLIKTPEETTYLFAGDFNGDGIDDVVGLGANGFLYSYYGSASSTFQKPVASTETDSSFSYIGNTVGDFDGDGHLDILGYGQILYGDGKGGFTPLSMTTATNGLVADLNHDGKSDLLSISDAQTNSDYQYYYNLVAELGQANRTFKTVNTSMGTYPPGGGSYNPVLLAIGDMNGDTIPDAAVFDPIVNELKIWLGNGDGTFKAGSSLSLAGLPWSPLNDNNRSITGFAFIADIDGDGNQDLAFLATETSTDTNLPLVTVLVIKYGNGKGGYSSTQILPLSHNYSAMLPMQLTTGSLPGFALSDGSMLGLIRNLGDRKFSNEEFYSAGSINGLVRGDFNGKDLSDLLIIRYNGQTQLIAAINDFTVLFDRQPSSGSGSALSNGTLSFNPNPVNYNQPFTLTATLEPSSSGSPTPTGTVLFSTAGLDFGSATLNDGVATLKVPGSMTQLLSPGYLVINANYSGDSEYAPVTISSDLHVNNPVYTTNTSFALTFNGLPVTSIPVDNFIAITATVTAPVPVQYGVVTFYDGTENIGSVSLSTQNPGLAYFSTNLLSIGKHSITASYSGFTPYSAEQGTNIFQPSTSTAALLDVTGLSSSTKLSVSASTITAGTVLSLTAQVSGSGSSPTGAVTFMDSGNLLGTYTLDANGKVVFKTASLAVGKHSLFVIYKANALYAGSTSNTVNVTVNAAIP